MRTGRIGLDALLERTLVNTSVICGASGTGAGGFVFGKRVHDAGREMPEVHKRLRASRLEAAQGGYLWLRALSSSLHSVESQKRSVGTPGGVRT